MQALDYAPPKGMPQILYEDEDLLLVHKPSGLLSVPGKAEAHRDCLQSRLQAHYPESLLIHRLDMDTSGVMVFARNKPAQRHLGLQFERRHVHKHYVACVDGLLEPDEGQVDLPLRVDWPNRPLQMVDPEKGRKAFTRWAVNKRGASWSRVDLFPKTGRSHQLRVHMAALGHPILGDRFYGDAQVVARAERLQLHAFRLSFYHPSGGARVAFEATCPF